MSPIAQQWGTGYVVLRVLISDLVNCLVIAVVHAVAAFDALDVVDGELLLLFHDGAVGALGFAGAALDAAIGDHICHGAFLLLLDFTAAVHIVGVQQMVGKHGRRAHAGTLRTASEPGRSRGNGGPCCQRQTGTSSSYAQQPGQDPGPGVRRRR